MQVRILAIAWMAVLLAGCGGLDGKLPLAGDVLVADRPVSEGSITLTSTTDPAQTAFGTIVNGKFSIAAENGLPAGSYRVSVFGFEPTGKQMEDPDMPGQMIDEKRSVVPAKYNDNSELVVEVTAENSQKLSFQLDAR